MNLGDKAGQSGRADVLEQEGGGKGGADLLPGGIGGGVGAGGAERRQKTGVAHMRANLVENKAADDGVTGHRYLQRQRIVDTAIDQAFHLDLGVRLRIRPQGFTRRGAQDARHAAGGARRPPPGAGFRCGCGRSACNG